MLRNREIQVFLYSMCLIGCIVTVLAGLFFSLSSAILVLTCSFLLILCSVLFTNWRYREIAKLSSYLRQISGGDYTFDVRDNREGELSILKNDIYKVTLRLSEHHALLEEDKTKLTQAISDISHQLKTPLTSMMVMSDLLNDSKLTKPKREEFTRNIRVQLERIDWLVSSLLKLSKIDAGTIQFKKKPVNAKALINKAVEPLLIPIDIRNQQLYIEGEESVSFIGDMNWTAEALINILKNSVEHTPEGGSIRLSYSENPLFTEIIVRDTGKGISKADLPFIFKRFYKGKNATDDSVGIGLAMAYSIIKNQQGDIEVTSEIGKGTCFSIKLYKQIV